MSASAVAATYDHAAAIKRRERRRILNGMLFSSPFWIGFLALTALPMLASIAFSFAHFDGLTTPKFIGLANYAALAQDTALIKALRNTVFYAVGAVPLTVLLGLLMAILLNQKVAGRSIWRSLYYLPAVTPTVAYAILWKWMLNKDYGVINQVLSWVKIPRVDWLGDPDMIVVAFIITSLWTVGGAMIVNLAGLQSIPTDLYDAAKVDGASPVQTFFAVTMPMMSPVLFYGVIMGIVGAMQGFDFFFTFTQGWGNVSYTDVGAVYMVHLYRVGFQLFRMGYASAMAWVLFFIILGLTFLVTRGSRKFVYYESEWLTGR